MKYAFNWWMMDSFFDDQVQSVLLKRHPSKLQKSPKDGEHVDAYTRVKAWRLVDAFALARRVADPEFIEVLEFDPAWMGELITAVYTFYLKRGTAWRGTETTRAKVERWRLQRYARTTKTHFGTYGTATAKTATHL